MNGPLETEIKLRLTPPHNFPGVLRDFGYREFRSRVFEANTLFDTEAGSLRNSAAMIRLREAGTRCVLTWKGKAVGGPHKSRPEIESEVSSAPAMMQILQQLGLRPIFRYEKYRTEFKRNDATGVITYDETPVGEFLELEGEPDWIDSTATALGFVSSDYILESYGKLFAAYRVDHGFDLDDMVFQAASGVSRE